MLKHQRRRRVNPIYRVNQAEYVIHILVAAA